MGIHRILHLNGKIYTLDREDGRPFYGEEIIEVKGEHYREWIPWRSKLGALFKKRDLSIPDVDVLYLGAAQGTTVSHLSDILDKGRIFAVEFSSVAFRKLVHLSRRRDNIVPILADAFHPERYRSMVPSVGMLYQDVSQKDQTRMFSTNGEMFLDKNGLGILMLKARSVDVTARPEDVYNDSEGELRTHGYEVISIEDLSPFQKDHAAIEVRYRS